MAALIPGSFGGRNFRGLLRFFLALPFEGRAALIPDSAYTRQRLYPADYCNIPPASLGVVHFDFSTAVSCEVTFCELTFSKRKE